MPHAICITTANITDREGAKTLLRQHAKRLSRVNNVMVDGGYRSEAFANSVKVILGETVTIEVAKRDELHTFKVIPKRWVVERSFAWLEKNRVSPRLSPIGEYLIVLAIHQWGYLDG